MPEAYSLDLRERVARFVEGGRSCRGRCRAVQRVGCFRRHSRAADDRHAKLDPHRAFLLGRIAEKADMTMPELSAELATATGTKADPALSRRLIRNGYRFKKTLLASEQDRPDIKAAREEWTTTRQPRMRLEA